MSLSLRDLLMVSSGTFYTVNNVNFAIWIAQFVLQVSRKIKGKGIHCYKSTYLGVTYPHPDMEIW